MYMYMCLEVADETGSVQLNYSDAMIHARTCTCTHTLQGFVPANNNVYTSETIIPAAFAAIDDINADCSILPDYLLELEFVNTKVNPALILGVCTCMFTVVAPAPLSSVTHQRPLGSSSTPLFYQRMNSKIASCF